MINILKMRAQFPVISKELAFRIRTCVQNISKLTEAFVVYLLQ